MKWKKKITGENLKSFDKTHARIGWGVQTAPLPEIYPPPEEMPLVSLWVEQKAKGFEARLKEIILRLCRKRCR